MYGRLFSLALILGLCNGCTILRMELERQTERRNQVIFDHRIVAQVLDREDNSPVSDYILAFSYRWCTPGLSFQQCDPDPFMHGKGRGRGMGEDDFTLVQISATNELGVAEFTGTTTFHPQIFFGNSHPESDPRWVTAVECSFKKEKGVRTYELTILIDRDQLAVAREQHQIMREKGQIHGFEKEIDHYLFSSYARFHMLAAGKNCDA